MDLHVRRPFSPIIAWTCTRYIERPVEKGRMLSYSQTTTILVYLCSNPVICSSEQSLIKAFHFPRLAVLSWPLRKAIKPWRLKSLPVRIDRQKSYQSFRLMSSQGMESASKRSGRRSLQHFCPASMIIIVSALEGDSGQVMIAHGTGVSFVVKKRYCDLNHILREHNR